MSWFVLVYCVLFFFHFILYESEGKITAPPDGTVYTFLPGSTESITWTFDDDPSNVVTRTWSFTNGASLETFAVLVVGNQLTKLDGVLPSFDIKTPATLTLNNVNQSYNGTYRFALDVRGVPNGFISDVTVFIAKKPTVTLNCSSVTLNKGDDFICECKGLGGNPPANVTWYKDCNEMQGKTGTEEHLLNLKNIDETDRGTYRCVAESYLDPSYRDEKSIRLVGSTDTSIELSPNPAILNQSFTITCSSRGFPEPSYKISHNGSHTIGAKTYTINNVRWSDAGVYECNADNGFGIDKASEILKITALGEVTCSTLGCDNSGTVVVWHIVVTLLSGIIIGILFSYIVSCSRRRWCRNKKPERNSEPQADGVDTTYQELDLTKMNKEDNYQSLRGNAAASASNDAANDEQSTYTQLSKTRDVEDNYQSLT